MQTLRDLLCAHTIEDMSDYIVDIWEDADTHGVLETLVGTRNELINLNTEGFENVFDTIRLTGYYEEPDTYEVVVEGIKGEEVRGASLIDWRKIIDCPIEMVNVRDSTEAAAWALWELTWGGYTLSAVLESIEQFWQLLIGNMKE